MKAAVIIVSITAFATGALAQGSLTPPSTPVETMKTLEQIEPRTPISSVPYTITAPGSYYLTTNLTLATASQNGITVDSGDVTIDMMGFTLSGPGAGSGHGIFQASNLHRNLTAFNGKLVNWRGTAYVGGYAPSGLKAEGKGVIMKSVQAVTNHCGIVVGNGSVVTECTVQDNTGHGMMVGDDSRVSDCTARNNRYYGIHVYGGSTISGCTAQGNGNRGISAAYGNTVVECTAWENGDDGISAGVGSTVSDCSARDNVSDGIYTYAGCTVNGCTSRDNVGRGIYTQDGSTVINCTALFNKGDGISFSSDCRVSDNHSNRNGYNGDGAGIHATGADNRIEGNNVTGNDRGIDVDAAGNLIVRNSAAGNTVNWSIVVNNKVGTIVNAPNSTAISGSTGGTGVGSTNPWANFSF